MRNINTLLRLILLTTLISLNSCSNNSSSEINLPEKIYEGSIRLDTQIQVDDFGSKKYTGITGGLSINGILNTQRITNLDKLNTIKVVGTSINIQGNNELTNLNGLNSINEIGDYLWIRDNSNLTNIDALSNLTKIGGEIWIINSKITNLNGLNKINSLFKLRVAYNPELLSLSGLENLNKINGIIIENNPKLKNYCAIRNAVNSTTGSFPFSVINNLYNPTFNEIKTGSCSN